MYAISQQRTAKTTESSIGLLTAASRVVFLLTVLILSGLIRVEYGGIPWTMQTFCVLLVAWLAKPQESKLALAIYGVLIGGLTPWLVGHGMFPGATCGYWIGFMLAAAYIQSVKQMRGQHAVFLHSCIAQVLVLSSGWLWLSVTLGAAVAFQIGVVPFLWTDFAKVLAVTATVGAGRFYSKHESLWP